MADTARADDGDLDPRHAAVLLRRTTLRARRHFEPNPPWLLAIRAVLALAVYGALWLSVRGQHPYAHPTAAVIPVGIAVGLVNVAATITVARRANAGISGRLRLRPADIAVVTAAWAGVSVAVVALAGAGVSDSIAYGLFPAAAPPIVAGLVWAGIMTARADWRAVASGLAAAAIGAVAVVAGPAGAWAVVGVGMAVMLLEHAVEISWRQRA